MLPTSRSRCALSSLSPQLRIHQRRLSCSVSTSSSRATTLPWSEPPSLSNLSVDPNSLENSIVAVHGLDGDSHRSWTDAMTDICWLQHPLFLPSQFPNARIMAFGYNVNTDSEPISTATLEDHSRSLLAGLIRVRAEVRACILYNGSLPLILSRSPGSSFQKPRRARVLLAHSLGGIVIKEVGKCRIVFDTR